MAYLHSVILGVTNSLKSRGGLATLKTHTFYSRPLNEKSIVVDLGANVGEFASAITTTLGVTCHALEAVTSIFCQIPEMPRVHKYNLAISDRDGPVQIFESKNSECNSIHSAIASIYGLQKALTCTGITFQKFLETQGIERVDLLKVDIEGSEGLLFGSTPDRILRIIRQITIEFHDFVPGSISAEVVKRILARLKSLGFYCIPFSYIYPNMLNADLLFIRCDACNVSLRDRLCFFALKSLFWFERAKSSTLSCRRGCTGWIKYAIGRNPRDVFMGVDRKR